MDLGLYINFFEANFEDCEVTLMQANRAQYSKLRELRQKILELGIEAQVTAVDDKVYGYGHEQHNLAALGFSSKNVFIRQIPQLSSRLILEGYSKSLSADYHCYWKFGKVTAYYFNKPLLVTSRGVSLFRGFELQCIYLFNQETKNVTYGVVVDVVFTYKDPFGNRLSTHQIVNQYDQETLKELRVKQGDLAPTGGINLEVAKQRLNNLIVPFMDKRNNFILPCGINVSLCKTPTPIILATGE